ncbi:hypothetical protein BJ165DRAFT_1532204 [Panaeolus papilionaceus]|nr:hypothetical protein BJ165DRAFT_1532204 [Panaeolus papilionaceus]
MPNLPIQQGQADPSAPFATFDIDVLTSTAIAFLIILLLELFNSIIDEVNLVAPKDFSLPKVLYLLSRYFTLGCWVVVVVSTLTVSTPATCDNILIFLNLIYIPLHLVPHVFALYRAHAAGDRHPNLGIALILCLLAYLGIEVWVYGTEAFSPKSSLTTGGVSCFQAGSFNRSKFSYVTAGSIALNLISGLVFAYNWWKVKEHIIYSNAGVLTKTFYAQAVVFHSSNLLSSLVSTILLAGEFDTPLTSISFMLTLLLPNVLACRFTCCTYDDGMHVKLPLTFSNEFLTSPVVALDQTFDHEVILIPLVPAEVAERAWISVLLTDISHQVVLLHLRFQGISPQNE